MHGYSFFNDTRIVAADKLIAIGRDLYLMRNEKLLNWSSTDEQQISFTQPISARLFQCCAMVMAAMRDLIAVETTYLPDTPQFAARFYTAPYPCFTPQEGDLFMITGNSIEVYDYIAREKYHWPYETDTITLATPLSCEDAYALAQVIGDAVGHDLFPTNIRKDQASYQFQFR